MEMASTSTSPASSAASSVPRGAQPGLAGPHQQQDGGEQQRRSTMAERRLNGLVAGLPRAGRPWRRLPCRRVGGRARCSRNAAASPTAAIAPSGSARRDSSGGAHGRHQHQQAPAHHHRRPARRRRRCGAPAARALRAIAGPWPRWWRCWTPARPAPAAQNRPALLALPAHGHEAGERDRRDQHHHHPDPERVPHLPGPVAVVGQQRQHDGRDDRQLAARRTAPARSWRATAARCAA